MATSATGVIVRVFRNTRQHGGILLLWALMFVLLYSPTLADSSEVPQNDSYLLLANRDTIYQVNLDESNFTETVTNSSLLVNTVAIDYDIRRNFLFWSDERLGKIIQAQLDGSNPRVLIDSGISTVDGLAWDWMGGNLYWTDSYQHEIEVYSLDSRSRMQLVDIGEGATPRALVVDPTTRYLYWTDWGDEPRIERISMDGTDRQTLHNTSLVWPNGITIDYEAQIIYWVDAKLDKIESSFTNGSHRRLLSTTLIFHPFSVAFFDGVLYWSDWHLHQVVYAPEASLTSLVGLTPPLRKDPLGIKVVSEDAQPIASVDPCGENNGNCSHLCLLSATSNTSHICACPLGLMLEDNGMRCSSCLLAGYKSCCDNADDCRVDGRVSACHCDIQCRTFNDCCEDFSSLKCETSGNSSSTATPIPVITTPTPVTTALTPVTSTPTEVKSTPTPVTSTPTEVKSTPTPVTSTPTEVMTTSKHLEMATTIKELVQSSSAFDEESHLPAPLPSSGPDMKASAAAPVSSRGLQQNGGPTSSFTPADHDERSVLLAVFGLVGVLMVLILLALSILLFLFVLQRKKTLRRGVISSSSFGNNDPFNQLGDLSRKKSFKDSMDSGVDLDVKTDTQV